VRRGVHAVLSAPHRVGLVALLMLLLAPAARAVSYPMPVSVFPIPGSKVAAPGAQIVFRGIPSADIGQITVTGSKSGVHGVTFAPDSDGQGGSFLPVTAFTPGENVTVQSSLNVIGGKSGTWSFQVATPAGTLPFQNIDSSPRVKGDVSHFRSRPDLAPARIAVEKRGVHTSPGYIFVAPQRGPLQNGPMLLDGNGALVWFKPLPPKTWATDFRVQKYEGQPALTWWQGNETAGTGVGEGVISDSHYNVIGYVHTADGLPEDLHEFNLTPQGTALVTSYFGVVTDARSVKGGIQRQIVFDGVVQEIDVKTGLLLFQWDSLDHVPLTDSYSSPPKDHGHPFDYFHVNSANFDSDGNLIISSRNTWTIYKVNIQTGAIMWRLGGKHSTFKLGSGAATAWQHNAIMHAGDLLTVFDNGAGPPRSHPHSRGLMLRLNVTKHTATVAREFDHSPQLSSNFEGNVQEVPGGGVFTGWGQAPYFTEFNASGQTVFDARFVDANNSYRAYRFRWVGTPQTPPAVAASNRGRMTVVWMTWNGATQVKAWRVIGGSSTTAMKGIRTVRKTSFETATNITGHPNYLAVQALNQQGAVLSTSPAIKG
jgi:hypothetical protein